MTPRSLLLALLYTFLTLLVAFAVVMGGYLLAVAVQDSPLAVVLRIIGIACLLLLVIDAMLMVLVLALRAVAGHDRPLPPLRRPAPAPRSERPVPDEPGAGE